MSSEQLPAITVPLDVHQKIGVLCEHSIHPLQRLSSLWVQFHGTGLGTDTALIRKSEGSKLTWQIKISSLLDNRLAKI